MIVALDLCAGTGWGVACQRIGIRERGVEIMPEAIALREANGMQTVYRDVWGGLFGMDEVPQHRLQIASPPCQTFSPAGGGGGLAALAHVLDAIRNGLYLDPPRLHALTEVMDGRTALVLTPLAYAVKHLPEFIAWEQVPTVLPVWEACAEVLRGLGYSVWTGVLDAADYGVPQNRRRAVLMAKTWGVAAPPEPTKRTTLEAIRPDQDGLVSNYSSRGSSGVVRPGNKLPRGYRTIRQQSFTVTSKAGSMRWLPSEERVTLREAALIQSYPADFDLGHATMLQIGNAVPPLMAEAILRKVIE